MVRWDGTAVLGLGSFWEWWTLRSAALGTPLLKESGQCSGGTLAGGGGEGRGGGAHARSVSLLLSLLQSDLALQAQS